MWLLYPSEGLPQVRNILELEVSNIELYSTQL